MVPLLLRELAHLLHEGERLAKIAELKSPLDTASVLTQAPARHLAPWRCSASLLVSGGMPAATGVHTFSASTSVMGVDPSDHPTEALAEEGVYSLSAGGVPPLTKSEAERFTARCRSRSCGRRSH